MRYTLSLLFALFTSAVFSADVELPAELKVRAGRLVKIEAKTTTTKKIKWQRGTEDIDLIPSESGQYATLLVPHESVTKQGHRFLVFAWTADHKGEPTDAAVCVIVVGEVTPTPVPPTPVPPSPQPPPGPSDAPIPHEGFRVLMVYDTKQVLPEAQLQVMYSQEIEDYLNKKCVVGPDGQTKEWRIWSKDVAASRESKLWQDVMKRERKQIPWIVISNGKTGYEGPLPANIEEAMKLLKKYGGE